jgi:hypothetical protein
MNVHMNASFPIVPIAVAVAGTLLYAITSKEPWKELGRAAMWTGLLVAVWHSV